MIILLRKISIFALVSLLLVSMGFAKIKIIVVSHGEAVDAFWGVVKNAVEQAEQDFKRDKLQVIYRAPTSYNMVEMARLIDQAVAERPDGLVVSLPDANALGPSIRNAVKSGIPVISINSGSDDFKKLGIVAHVGQTEFEAGLGGGELMKSLNAKKTLIVNHEVGNVALDRRAEGYAQGFGGAYEVIGVSKDPTEIRSAVSAKFRRDGRLDSVLALGSSAGDPTLDAIYEIDKIDSVKVASFDLSGKLLEAAAKGDVVFLIDQQQYLQGYLPIAMLVQYKRFGTITPGVVQTGPGFVTPENAASVIAWQKEGYR